MITGNDYLFSYSDVDAGNRSLEQASTKQEGEENCPPAHVLRAARQRAPQAQALALTATLERVERLAPDRLPFDVALRVGGTQGSAVREEDERCCGDNDEGHTSPP